MRPGHLQLRARPPARHTVRRQPRGVGMGGAHPPHLLHHSLVYTVCVCGGGGHTVRRQPRGVGGWGGGVGILTTLTAPQPGVHCVCVWGGTLPALAPTEA